MTEYVSEVIRIYKVTYITSTREHISILKQK